MSEIATRFLIANLAAGVAVLLVLLLRKPVRAMFGARLAYALWLLIPLAALASFLPPRVIEVVVPAFDFAPLPPEEITPPAVADLAPAAATEFAAPGPDIAATPLDPWTIGLYAWIAGALAMMAWLAFGQSRFMSDARRGRAGPAVVGVIRPRIVTPTDFQDRFDERERDVILAHETIHLDRNDARINAFVALIRCICWFNPLIHVASHVMRIDQEMACDAMVVERYPRARGRYASALLKAQLAMRPLPLGCYWPAGSDHPLTERIEMLKQTTPGRMRRLAGVACLTVLAAGAGFGAWAAMPPQERFVAADTTVIEGAPEIALPAVELAPEPQSPQQTPAPAPQPTTTRSADNPLNAIVRGKIEKLEFGANSYVAFVRASTIVTYGAVERPSPTVSNTELWALSPTNYFGNREAIEADLKGKEVEVNGEVVNRDCKSDCRIKNRALLRFARSTEVPAPAAGAGLVGMFAHSYDTTMPQLVAGTVQKVVFHDNNRTFDLHMQSDSGGGAGAPGPLFQVRMEYRHPRADIERELLSKAVIAHGWRAREVIGTYCAPVCGMFADSLEVGDRSGTAFVPRVRVTPDGATLVTPIAATAGVPPPGAGKGSVVTAQLRIVALRRERLELSSRDMTKFVDRYFEPGEVYLLGGAFAGDWTVSTPDGSAFEWRAGNTSFGPIGAGPVNAQSITSLSQRAILATAQPTAPHGAPAAPQPAPQRATPATPQPTRYEPQQTPRFTAQQAPAGPEPSLDVRADSLSTDQGSGIVTYNGNVEVLLNGDRVLTADRMTLEKAQRASTARSMWILRADAVVSDTNADTITLEGSAQAQFGSTLLKGEKLTISNARSKWLLIEKPAPPHN
jgi:beta-lactamase regulating signal transducer with metallopeptidase domain